MADPTIFTDLATNYNTTTAVGKKERTFTISSFTSDCLDQFSILFNVNPNHIVEHMLNKIFKESDFCHQIDIAKTNCETNIDTYKDIKEPIEEPIEEPK